MDFELNKDEAILIKIKMMVNVLVLVLTGFQGWTLLHLNLTPFVLDLLGLILMTKRLSNRGNVTN